MKSFEFLGLKLVFSATQSSYNLEIMELASQTVTVVLYGTVGNHKFADQIV